MSLPRRALVTLTAVLFLTGLGACASRSKDAEALNNLVGNANKAYFVEKLGPPDKQASIDSSTDVWEYRLNEQKYTSQTGYRFETFDRLRLTFREGVLASWKTSYETK